MRTVRAAALLLSAHDLIEARQVGGTKRPLQQRAIVPVGAEDARNLYDATKGVLAVLCPLASQVGPTWNSNGTTGTE